MTKVKKVKIVDIIVIIIALVVLWQVFNIYRKYNYSDYIKVTLNSDITSFSRDNEIKYNDNTRSYKIESKDFNDAMFYKEVKVEPNTPYKVTCMVKTKNVEIENLVSIAGAHISIADTVEKSESIIGTSDWTEVELLFNSKNRTSVNIGFRLGSYEDDAKGTAWFSEFTIESGTLSNTSNWNVACFVLQNVDTDVNINGTTQNVKISMTSSDVNDMKQCMARFAEACTELSRR